jgi:hypothetical protein
MNFRNNRSWIILLGSGIGLLIGVILSTIWLNAPPRWKQQSYPAVSASADRAEKLLAFDYTSGILYVKSQSQKVYGCRVPSLYGNPDTGECFEESSLSEKLAQILSCKWQIFSTPQPPGTIISQITEYPCIFESSTQTDYILLEDGSLWTVAQEIGELSTGFNNCFSLMFPIAGLFIGLIIGVVIAKFA